MSRKKLKRTAKKHEEYVEQSDGDDQTDYSGYGLYDDGDEDEAAEVHDLMEDYDLDEDEASEVKNLMEEESIDADEAIELRDLSGSVSNGSGGYVLGFLIVGVLIWGAFSFFDDDSTSDYMNGELNSDAYYYGNPSHSGGSATERYEYTPSYVDDPYTTNDESNDQPVGFYGTETVYACNQSSGNCYDLDADSDGESIERLYFPKGGWVDIDYSDCDGGYCYLEDENGNEWEIEY